MKNSQLVESFNATVLFQNKKYSIEKYLNNNTGKFSMVVVRDSTFTDWVMVYDPGKIAFDDPYLLPKYIKDKARKFSLTLN